MKVHFLTFFMGLLAVAAFSQISYEKGYYITNSGQRIECQIRNMGWKNNPRDFEYRLSETSAPQTAELHKVKEFGLIDSPKFVRATVGLDRSSANIKNLGSDKNPIFRQEELFL